MDFDVDLPDLTCPDLFLISVERVTYIIPQAVVAALNAANFCELVTDGDAPPTNTFQFPGPCKSGLFLQR